MPYTSEITFYSNGEEMTWEGVHATLQEAVDYLNSQAGGCMCRAWINNKKVMIRNGHVVGKDGQPFSTNPKFHDIFADDDYPRLSAVEIRMPVPNRAADGPRVSTLMRKGGDWSD